MLLIPYALDDMRVRRVPPISVGIAGLCLLLWNFTWITPQGTFETFGLVPERGFAQIGWLTSLFIHVDIFHLLGNLLFFYIAGPCLEDAWGTTRFLLLYVLGGIAAGLAQFSLDPASSIPIVGASGAISACIGAMCVQFPKRKVRIFYWLLFWFGSFRMLVWLWGGLWFLRDVYDLALAGPDAGVAFGAHVGGFVFGAAFAFAVIKVQGDPFAQKYGAEKDPVPVRPPAKQRPVLSPIEPSPVVAPVAPTAPAARPVVESTPVTKPEPVAPAEPRAFPKRPT